MVMSSVRTPQDKKQLAYARDHYAKGKYDKAFRETWPRKKHKSGRSFRHAADTLTRAAALDGESDAEISAIKKKPLTKWPVSKLGEIVPGKLAKRAGRVGAKKARRVAMGRRQLRAR
jgi:hypothetical protein